jgi:hypothetical protein
MLVKLTPDGENIVGDLASNDDVDETKLSAGEGTT